MQPEIHLFGLTLQTFGICFAVGFLAAGALIERRLRELGQPPELATHIVFGALIGGLVGARGYWLIQHWEEIDGDVLGSIFSGSGLVWYGGALGGAAGVLIAAGRKHFINLTMADLCAAPLALGYAIGRIGCQLSGDGDYGKSWDGPWAMGYPDGTVPTAPGEQVHPTPVYETLTMGLFAWLLWHLRDRFRPGILFAIYLVGAGTERFLVEFVRRNEDVLLGLTAAQLQSLAMALAGLIWLALAARSGTLRRPQPGLT